MKKRYPMAICLGVFVCGVVNRNSDERHPPGYPETGMALPLRKRVGKDVLQQTKEGPLMSVAKIIEISCESPKSFEDAVQSGIARASKTIHNMKGAWVKEQS
jgi:hypothetical protein